MTKQQVDINSCLSLSLQRNSIDASFCVTWSLSHLIPKEHPEAYINYKLIYYINILVAFIY